MGRRGKQVEQFTVRQHERDDCIHYETCLNEAAHGGGRNKGGLRAVPCLDCPRYETGRVGLALSPWRKRGDWDPTLG